MEPASPRVPPHSLEAEVAVLGSILLDNQQLDRVVEILGPEDLYYEKHRKVFSAMLDLDRRSEPVDSLTLIEALKTRGELAEVGGASYVSELLDRTVTAANLGYYARIVREKAILRSLIATATEIVQRGFEGREDVNQFVDQAEQAIYQIAERKTRVSFTRIGSMIMETFKHIEKLYERKEMVTGVPTGFLDLDRLTAGLQPSDLIIVAGRPSMGKCLAADAEIVLSDGRVETIGEICRRREAEILTLGEDLRFAAARPSAFVDDGEKPVFRLTTRLGRTVKTTITHPFLTIDGWKPLAELRVGDRVAVPREIPVFGQASIGEHRVKLLAYLLGDGGLRGACPTFTNGNSRLRDDFTEAVRSFPGLTVSETTSNGTRTPTLRVSADRVSVAGGRRRFARSLDAALHASGRSARRLAADLGVSPASITHWRQGRTVPETTFGSLAAALGTAEADLAPDGLAAIRRAEANALTRWLTELGLWGKGANGKFVPAVIFTLARREIAIFLNRMFATDGWATVLASGQAQLGYASTSERLARQVQHLLLRFGVIAALRRRSMRYRGEARTAWQLDITDAESIRRVCEEIGIFGKEEALARVSRAIGSRRYQTNRDLIPAGIWRRIDESRQGRTWRWLGGRLGLAAHGMNLHVGARGISRSRLLRIAGALEDRQLEQLAKSDVYWDEIVSIEAVGVGQVYDLTVPRTHNFVADDVCVHNTSFCLNIAEHVAIDNKIGVAVFSLEMSKEQLVLRMLCSQAQVDLNKVRTGFLAAKDFPKLATAAGRIADAPIYIDDSPALSALELRAKARRLRRDKEANLGLIVVDYLQLMRGSGGNDSREQEISEISRSLKALAKELRIPVIALSQLNRQVENRTPPKPRMADLRESGAIEQDADVIMFIYRDEVYNAQSRDEGKADIIVAKQRNGPTDEVKLAFRREFTRFENLEEGFGDLPASDEAP